MAGATSCILQPYTVENSHPRSIVLTSRAPRLVHTCTYTCGQANYVPGCTEYRPALLGEKQVLVASTRKDEWNWLTPRLKYSLRAGTDERKGQIWRRSCKAAGKDQVDSGAEIGAIISTPAEAGRLFIFGFGYTSSALAFGIKDKNWKISGTCRRSEDRSILEDCGFHTHLFNSDNDGEELKDIGLQELQQATHWLISIPPVGDFDKDPVLAVHKEDLIQAAARGNVRWIGYLSSTGVYGDWLGDWVDEDIEPRPSEQKAIARLAAERDWLSFGKAHGVAVQVFRLGGIYGAGRSALNTILQKRTLSGPQRERRRFTSRIHVADVCQVLTASMEIPCPGRIYNVVDDDPASRKEVFAFARELLGHQTVDTKETEEALKSGDSNISSYSFTQCAEKRVSNRRIKEELQIQLLHPSYKSGLRAILKNS